MTNILFFFITTSISVIFPLISNMAFYRYLPNILEISVLGGSWLILFLYLFFRYFSWKTMKDILFDRIMILLYHLIFSTYGVYLHFYYNNLTAYFILGITVIVAIFIINSFFQKKALKQKEQDIIHLESSIRDKNRNKKEKFLRFDNFFSTLKSTTDEDKTKSLFKIIPYLGPVIGAYLFRNHLMVSQIIVLLCVFFGLYYCVYMLGYYAICLKMILDFRN